MKLIKINDDNLGLLKEFCSKCKELGWINNSSLEAMRFKSTIESGGGFFGILNNDALVSIAGYHPFPEMHDAAWRIFYRSATLPNSNTNKSLHRGTGPRGRIFLNAFISELPNTDLYVTTNIVNDNFKSIVRYNRSLELESKMKDSYVSFVKEMIVYETKQSVWKIDVQKYLERNKNDNQCAN